MFSLGKPNSSPMFSSLSPPIFFSLMIQKPICLRLVFGGLLTKPVAIPPHHAQCVPLPC